MRDIFELEKHTEIDRNQSYIRSYPHLVAWLGGRERLNGGDVTCAAHMVYGWMPTVLELHVSDGFGIDDAAVLLNMARREGKLADPAVAQLAGLVNHSVVGASKLLHFLSPEAFAIWDSRIYRFIYQKAHRDITKLASLCRSHRILWRDTFNRVRPLDNGWLIFPTLWPDLYLLFQ